MITRRLCVSPFWFSEWMTSLNAWHRRRVSNYLGSTRTISQTPTDTQRTFGMRATDAFPSHCIACMFENALTCVGKNNTGRYLFRDLFVWSYAFRRAANPSLLFLSYGAVCIAAVGFSGGCIESETEQPQLAFASFAFVFTPISTFTCVMRALNFCSRSFVRMRGCGISMLWL